MLLSIFAAFPSLSSSLVHDLISICFHLELTERRRKCLELLLCIPPHSHSLSSMAIFFNGMKRRKKGVVVALWLIRNRNWIRTRNLINLREFQMRLDKIKTRNWKKENEIFKCIKDVNSRVDWRIDWLVCESRWYASLSAQAQSFFFFPTLNLTFFSLIRQEF